MDLETALPSALINQKLLDAASVESEECQVDEHMESRCGNVFSPDILAKFLRADVTAASCMGSSPGIHDTNSENKTASCSSSGVLSATLKGKAPFQPVELHPRKKMPECNFKKIEARALMTHQYMAQVTPNSSTVKKATVNSVSSINTSN